MEVEMTRPTLNSGVHGLSGKCATCGAPLEHIVSCTMDKCPIPTPTDAERAKLLDMLKAAAK